MSSSMMMGTGECFQEILNLRHFSELCMNGLYLGTEASRILEITKRRAETGRGSEFPQDPDEQRHLQTSAAKLEDFAKKQRDQGFPMLFSLMTIKLWSLLETLIDHTAVDWLKIPESCEDQDLIKSVKGPLVEFTNATVDEQSEYLAEEVKILVKASLKKGIDRFESILEPLGLSGSIDKNVRRPIFELSQVRNLLVHKSGIIDKKFVEICPWLDIETGEQLSISGAEFHRYISAVTWYVLEVEHRIIQREGGVIPPDSIDLQNELIESLTN